MGIINKIFVISATRESTFDENLSTVFYDSRRLYIGKSKWTSIEKERYRKILNKGINQIEIKKTTIHFTENSVPDFVL